MSHLIWNEASFFASIITMISFWAMVYFWCWRKMTSERRDGVVYFFVFILMYSQAAVFIWAFIYFFLVFAFDGFRCTGGEIC
jgi:hypothetical protein